MYFQKTVDGLILSTEFLFMNIITNSTFDLTDKRKKKKKLPKKKTRSVFGKNP